MEEVHKHGLELKEGWTIKHSSDLEIYSKGNELIEVLKTLKFNLFESVLFRLKST